MGDTVEYGNTLFGYDYDKALEEAVKSLPNGVIIDPKDSNYVLVPLNSTDGFSDDCFEELKSCYKFCKKEVVSVQAFLDKTVIDKDTFRRLIRNKSYYPGIYSLESIYSEMNNLLDKYGLDGNLTYYADDFELEEGLTLEEREQRVNRIVDLQYQKFEDVMNKLRNIPVSLTRMYDEAYKKCRKTYPNADFYFDNVGNLIVYDRISVKDYCADNNVYIPVKNSSEDTFSCSFTLAEFLKFMEAHTNSSQAEAIINLITGINYADYASYKQEMSPYEDIWRYGPGDTPIDLSINKNISADFLGKLSDIGICDDEQIKDYLISYFSLFGLSCSFGENGKINISGDISSLKEMVPDTASDNSPFFDFFFSKSFNNYVDSDGTATLRFRIDDIPEEYRADFLEWLNSMNGKGITVENCGGYLKITIDDFDSFDIENEKMVTFLEATSIFENSVNYTVSELNRKINISLGVDTDLNFVFLSKDVVLEHLDELGKEYGPLKDQLNGFLNDPSSDLYKLYQSTYNDFSIIIPYTGNDDFNSIPQQLNDIVYSDGQAGYELGYSLSVRMDANPNDYKYYSNILGLYNDVEDADTGKVSHNLNGYRIVLENNQKIELEYCDKYSMSDVQSQVTNSSAYKCCQMNDLVQTHFKANNGTINSRFINGKYYVSINGVEVELDNAEDYIDEYGNFKNSEKESDFYGLLDDEYSIKCKEIYGEDSEPRKNLTLVNDKIINKPNCISFNDETDYKNIIRYLDNDFITKLDSSNVKTSFKAFDDITLDNEFEYSDVFNGRTKLSDKVAEIKDASIQLSKKVETSMRLLRAYDNDLKFILDQMVADIFELGVYDSSENTMYINDSTVTDSKYESFVNDLLTSDDETRIAISEYFAKIPEFCKEQMNELLDMSRGVLLSDEDIEFLTRFGVNFADNIFEYDGKKFISFNDFNFAIAECAPDGMINDDYTVTDYLNTLCNVNEKFFDINYHYQVHGTALLNIDKLASEYSAYKAVANSSKFYMDVLSDEYDESLDYIRENYDTTFGVLPENDNICLLSLEELALYSVWETRNKYIGFGYGDGGTEGIVRSYDTSIADILLTPNMSSGEKLAKMYANRYTMMGVNTVEYWQDFDQINQFLTLATGSETTFKSRQGKELALAEAKNSIADGKIDFFESMVDDKFWAGVGDMGNNISDFLAVLGQRDNTNVFEGLEFLNSVGDYKESYLRELYSGNYTRREVEQMYKKGQITEKEYKIRMKILETNSQVSSSYKDYEEWEDVSKTIGSVVPDILFAVLTGGSSGAAKVALKTGFAALKGFSAAGKTARKLYGSNADMNTIGWASITQAVSYTAISYIMSKTTVRDPGKSFLVNGKIDFKTMSKTYDRYVKLSHLSSTELTGALRNELNDLLDTMGDSIIVFRFVANHSKELTAFVNPALYTLGFTTAAWYGSDMIGAFAAACASDGEYSLDSLATFNKGFIYDLASDGDVDFKADAIYFLKWFLKENIK